MQHRTKTAIGIAAMACVGVAGTIGVVTLIGHEVKPSEKVTLSPTESWCAYAKYGAGSRMLNFSVTEDNGADVAFIARGFLNPNTPKVARAPLAILIKGIDELVAHDKPVTERVASEETIAAAAKVDEVVAAKCK